MKADTIFNRMIKRRLNRVTAGYYATDIRDYHDHCIFYKPYTASPPPSTKDTR